MTDPLVFEMLNAFDEWWRTEQHLHATTDLARVLARRAFVAGFREGGKIGAELMHDGAMKLLRKP